MVIVQKNSIEYRFVVVETVSKVQIHCLSQMIKATNKHGFLLSKIVDIKRFLQMSPMHKVRKFKIFLIWWNLDSKMSGTKQGQQKMKSTSNMVITYFLFIFFFLLELKNKKIYLHCIFIVKKITPINWVNGNIYTAISFK